MTVYQHEVAPYPGIWHRENGRDRLWEKQTNGSRPEYVRIFESERLKRSYSHRRSQNKSEGT